LTCFQGALWDYLVDGLTRADLDKAKDNKIKGPVIIVLCITKVVNIVEEDHFNSYSHRGI